MHHITTASQAHVLVSPYSKDGSMALYLQGPDIVLLGIRLWHSCYSTYYLRSEDLTRRDDGAWDINLIQGSMRAANLPVELFHV